MSLQKTDFNNAESVALTDDDLLVLNVIYQSRIRTFLFVFVTLFLLALVSVGQFIFYPENAILVCSSVFGLLIFVIIPGIIVFRKRVLVYRQDIRAGFKLKIYEQVIDKQYFPTTDQYFLSLNNADYLHHEVEAEVYALTSIGDRYPVYFAAQSQYPFTLRSRITMM